MQNNWNSYTAGEMENETNTLENSWAISCKAKYIFTRNPTPRDIKIYIHTKYVPKYS